MTWITAAIRRAGIERRLDAGQTLFRLGSRAAGLYEVMSGKIRLVRVTASFFVLATPYAYSKQFDATGNRIF